MQSDELLTVAQVADQLKLHPETIRRWVRDGKLPAVKLSGSDRAGFRIRASDLQRLVNQ